VPHRAPADRELGGHPVQIAGVRKPLERMPITQQKVIVAIPAQPHRDTALRHAFGRGLERLILPPRPSREVREPLADRRRRCT